MYGAGRDDSANQDLYINGVGVASEADASTGVPDLSLYACARNNNATPGFHIDATLSTLKKSPAIGFNQSLHNTNVRIALTAYGSI